MGGDAVPANDAGIGLDSRAEPVSNPSYPTRPWSTGPRLSFLRTDLPSVWHELRVLISQFPCRFLHEICLRVLLPVFVRRRRENWRLRGLLHATKEVQIGRYVRRNLLVTNINPSRNFRCKGRRYITSPLLLRPSSHLDETRCIDFYAQDYQPLSS